MPVKGTSLHSQNCDQTVTASSGERGNWVLCRSCSRSDSCQGHSPSKEGLLFAPLGIQKVLKRYALFLKEREVPT